MHRISDTLTQVEQRINAAAALSSRNVDEITLLAVSKKQAADKIRSAAEHGINNFGENYLQEALAKQNELSDLNVCWHFIGPIQTNKTRSIAEHFDWVHSVDRLKIAQRLSIQREPNPQPINLCLQVNIDSEATKSGVLVSDLEELARAVSQLPNLRLRGLMVIPRSGKTEAESRETFRNTKSLMLELNAKLGLDMDTLSMGMSSDLDAAIAEGATIVRIGTALFGQRT